MTGLPKRNNGTGRAITLLAVTGLLLSGFAVPAAGHQGQSDPTIWSGPPSNANRPINIETVTFDGQLAANGAGSGMVERFEFSTKNIPKELTFDGVQYDLPVMTTVIIDHFVGNWFVSQGNNVKFQGTAHALTTVSDSADPTYTRTRVLIQTEPSTQSIRIDMLLQAAGTTVLRHEHLPALSPVPIKYVHDISKTAAQATNVGSYHLTIEDCTFQGFASTCVTLFNPDPQYVNQVVPVPVLGGKRICIQAPEQPTSCSSL